jgi:hypothetical protein
MSVPDELPPRFWRTWRRFYTIQLIYWLVVLVLMIIGTRMLNQ